MGQFLDEPFASNIAAEIISQARQSEWCWKHFQGVLDGDLSILERALTKRLGPECKGLPLQLKPMREAGNCVACGWAEKEEEYFEGYP